MKNLLSFLSLFFIYSFHLESGKVWGETCSNSELESVCAQEGGSSTASGSNGTPNTASGSNGTPNTASGSNGTPNTASGSNGTPNTASGSNGTPNTASGSSGTVTPPKTCKTSYKDAKTCCGDPMTCLGSSSLETIQTINQIASTVGTAIGPAFSGKDSKEICSLVQYMSGAGAGIAFTARFKCFSSISSCQDDCKAEKEKKCKEYRDAKTICTQATVKTFETKSKTLVKDIDEIENKKITCISLKANTKHLEKNALQFINSAVFATLCKVSAGLEEDKPDNSPETLLGGGNPMGEEKGLTPTVDGSAENESNDETNPDLEGGGGRFPADRERDIPLNLGKTTSNYGGKLADTPSANQLQNGKNTSFGSNPWMGRGKRTRENNREDEFENSENSSSMGGGGGFGGYGGGKYKSKYSSLALSAKKLKALEKQQGIKRKSASLGIGSGIHQNIFERITRRFKYLCQKGGLKDCF